MVFIADYLWPQHDNLISILNSPSVSGHGTADTAGLDHREEVIILIEVHQTEKLII